MNIKITGVKDLQLTNNNIHSIRIEEYSGLRLPIAKVQVEVTNNYAKQIRLGMDLNIEFSDEDNNAVVEHTFHLVDYKNQPSMDGKTVLVEFSLMHKYNELVKTYKQELFEGTSSDILSSYGFEVEINCEDDPQIYIRPNISKKAFFRQLIQHTYLGVNDCPISTISLNGKKVKSLVDTFKGEAYIKLSRDSATGYEGFRVIQRESSSVLSDQLFGIDNVNSILRSDTNNVYYLDYQGEEIADLTKYSKEHNLVLNRTINDNCNCHKNYYKAQIRNRTGWLALNSERIIVELSTRGLRFDIPILSIVEIFGKEDEDSYKDYYGKWLVTGKYIGVDRDIATTYLQLSRVPKEYFKRFKDV